MQNPSKVPALGHTAWWAWTIWGIVLYLISYFVLSPDGSQPGHDIHAHVAMVAGFSEQFKSGEFYPRWILSSNLGLGSPVFFAYPPLAAYSAALVLRLLPGLGEWEAIRFASLLLLALSGLICRIWLKRFTSPNLATLFSVLYMVAPYHLAVDFMERGALAEFSSFLCFPLALLGAHKLTTGERGVGLVALGVGLAVCAHPISAFFLVVLCISFAFTARWEVRFRCFASVLLGLGLSAFYFFPALVTSSSLQAHFYESSPQQYLCRISDSLVGFELNGSFFPFLAAIGLSQALLAVLSLVILWSPSFDANRCASLSFWAAASLVMYFLMTPFSRPFWDVLPGAGFVKFPWRLLAPMTATTLAALAVATNVKGCKQIHFLWAMVVFVLLSIAPRTCQTYVLWSRFPPQPSSDTLQLRLAPAEHLPNEAPLDLLAASRTFLSSTGGCLWRPVSPGGVQIWKPRRIQLDVLQSADGPLEVCHLYMRGWESWVDSQPSPVFPSRLGFLQTIVPKGQHRVIFLLPYSGVERAGGWISLGSLLLIFLFSTPLFPLRPQA